jgi:hypothetical protein
MQSSRRSDKSRFSGYYPQISQIRIRKVGYHQQIFEPVVVDNSAMSLGGSAAPSSAGAARTDDSEKWGFAALISTSSRRLLDPP